MNNKQRITASVDACADELKEIAAYIARNPELGNEEFKASARLRQALTGHGFDVEAPVLGIETAFIGTFASDKPGPTVALLCEYDALPEIGHACGHHLICTMSLGAAIGLKDVIAELGGTLRVYGTPAEETRGAKVTMADAGLFDDCDFALMAHPYYAFQKSGSSLAMDAIQYEFYGKSSHAAASPEAGINALDAVLQLFNGINALRQQTRSDARIHGIINHGGVAANVIPDYASAQFYVRSADRPYTDELVGKVRRIAEGAAMQTGCEVKISNYEYSYDELITNEALSETFTRNLVEAGVEPGVILEPENGGSADVGNVSTRCPAIHPYVQVVYERHELHSIGFRDLAQKDEAYDAMIFGAKMLAGTAYDVLTVPGLLERVRAEFARSAGASAAAERP
ncbi:M20 family metallopeptidase [Saccharibacillus alkalitolerans]|uniref:Peptidase M20 domain-containing protein 2 n=1 Tax=Saccharibacillus alkalitolerans TaxID=2705290 RepID=A0ABX0F0K3_9BACL|nr:M20 family metallopeptidase [Saccharibacillus alkalitolerans]NGZ74527.1 M20 family metallopeptidase [Saccharibacillus alkalitolerans]